MSNGPYRDDTRYGFPPDIDQRMPAEVPWDVPISELPAFSLEIVCCKGTTVLPLRLVAARHGWELPLRTVVEHLTCDACKRAPESVTFVPRLNGDGHSNGKRAGLRLR
jgi:hypothetical protein